MPIDALLFDKDGTLFEFAATWEAWAEAFLLRATGNDRAHATRIGGHIGFDMATRQFAADSLVIANTPDEIAAAMVPHMPDWSHNALLEMLNLEAEGVTQIEAVPLVAYLDALRGDGLKLGVATNDAHAPAMAHLNAAGIVGHFDFIAGSDSGFGAKPDTGQMLAFARAVDLHPARIAMVGDSAHDLIAGRAAGMTTIGVLTGIADQDDLTGLADVVLPDIGHIPAWLAS